MPKIKMKTRKSVSKRITLSGAGKMMIRHSRTGHNKACKSESEKRRLSVPSFVTTGDARNVKRALPYLGK
jgi:ribosomal protein L35